MITSHDVAKAAGVSVATVSRAFSPASPINEKTRMQVLKVAEEMGYTPNAVASSLRNKTSKLLGFISPNSTNAFFDGLLNDIEMGVSAQGYRLLILFSGRISDIDSSAIRESSHLRTMLSLGVDGLFYVPSKTANMEAISASNKVLSQYRTHGVPVLQCLFDFHKDLHSLTVDNTHGLAMATSHLLERGHRKIMLVDVVSDVEYNTKAKGYFKAFEDAGIPADPNFFVQMPDGIDSKHMLHQSISELKPTAIIASQFSFTTAVLRSMKDLGLKYPNDISLISYEDNDWLSYLDITAMTILNKRIGTEASALMLDCLLNNSSASRVYCVIEPVMIHRNSVRYL